MPRRARRSPTGAPRSPSRRGNRARCQPPGSAAGERRCWARARGWDGRSPEAANSQRPRLPVVTVGEPRSCCRQSVRRFEPRLDGPRRAPTRIETHALSWEDAMEEQVDLDGGIQPTTAPRLGGCPWSATSMWGSDGSGGYGFEDGGRRTFAKVITARGCLLTLFKTDGSLASSARFATLPRPGTDLSPVRAWVRRQHSRGDPRRG